MSISYDLYGFYADKLEFAQTELEQALDKKMMEHECLYRGEYLRLEIGRESFVLQMNIDHLDGEYLEPEFADYPIILYVSETSRSNELQKVLEDTGQCIMLKHNEYD